MLVAVPGKISGVVKGQPLARHWRRRNETQKGRRWGDLGRVYTPLQ